MKKINVLLFGISILGFSFYGLSTSSFYVQILMNTSVPFTYARIALVAALLTYVFVPSLRLYTTKALVSATGISMLLIGLISVGSPSLLGHANTYILIGDSLILIEAGILAVVLSAELSARRTQFTMKAFNYTQALFTDSLKNVAHTKMTDAVVKDTNLAQHLTKRYALPSKNLL